MVGGHDRAAELVQYLNQLHIQVRRRVTKCAPNGAKPCEVRQAMPVHSRVQTAYNLINQQGCWQLPELAMAGLLVLWMALQVLVVTQACPTFS